MSKSRSSLVLYFFSQIGFVCFDYILFFILTIFIDSFSSFIGARSTAIVFAFFANRVIFGGYSQLDIKNTIRYIIAVILVWLFASLLFMVSLSFCPIFLAKVFTDVSSFILSFGLLRYWVFK